MKIDTVRDNASELFYRGKANEAAAFIEKWIPFFPEQKISLQLLRGEILLRSKGNERMAADQFQKILDVNPCNIDALNGLAQFHLKAARSLSNIGSPASRSAYIRHIRESDDVLLDARKAYAKSSKTPEDTAAYFVTLSLTAQSHTARGFLYQNDNMPDHAAAYFEEATLAYDEALTIDPKNIQLLNAYAHLMKTVGRIEKAEALFYRSIKAEPENPYTFRSIGRFYAELSFMADNPAYIQNSINAYKMAIECCDKPTTKETMLKELQRFQMRHGCNQPLNDANPATRPPHEARPRAARGEPAFSS